MQQQNYKSTKTPVIPQKNDLYLSPSQDKDNSLTHTIYANFSPPTQCAKLTQTKQEILSSNHHEAKNKSSYFTTTTQTPYFTYPSRTDRPNPSLTHGKFATSESKTTAMTWICTYSTTNAPTSSNHPSANTTPLSNEYRPTLIVATPPNGPYKPGKPTYSPDLPCVTLTTPQQNGTASFQSAT